MHLFHRWGRWHWADYTGRWMDMPDLWQGRKCLKCGKGQRRFIG